MVGQARPEGAEGTAIAPGRVNLLGEHTDYTGGLALTLAIDRSVVATVRPRSDGQIVLQSDLFASPVRIPASEEPRPGPERWANYLLGTVAELWERADFRRGFEVQIHSDLPMGFGLGSSGALTVACAKALNELFRCGLEPLEIVKLCQRAEQRFVGVRCGVMDQAAAALSEPRHALFLNCRTLETQPVPFPDCAVAVIHSGIRHELAESEYNRRVSECEEALGRLPGRLAGLPGRLAGLPGRQFLGELRISDLREVRRALSEPLRNRVEHIVGENARVRQGLRRLEKGDLPGFGALMKGSHASLRDLYKVSCPELDQIVRNTEGIAYGAKMTGAGFGGAVVALVSWQSVEELSRLASEKARVLICKPYSARG